MGSLIEPSSFDLIVLGTGLPQCIIAAAAANSGRSVLHLDICDFYGSHWASLPFQDFSDWCLSAGQLPFHSSPQVPTSHSNSRADGDVVHHGSASIESLETMRDPAMEANVQTVMSCTMADSCADGDAVHHGSASIESLETMRDPAIETNVQNGRNGLATVSAEDTTMDGKEILDVEGQDAARKVLGESAQYAEVNSTLGSEDDGMQMQDAQKATSRDNSASLAALTMEEMGLEPVMVEPSTSMYRNFHFVQNSVESLGPSRRYCIDLAGPKLAFCGGPLVDLLLRSGASNYLEFKNLEGSFMWSTDGLASVPSSRADIFKDRTLSNAEKRHLMRFFKLVVEHTSSNSDACRISKEEMDSPFVEFLQARQVPSSVQAMILYAIALSNQKQDPTENGQYAIMSTREGMESLALYLTSVGRFVNATGAFLYPLYGQGELPQAFSRCAAVKGALYALKMPIHALLRDKETHKFKGVQISTNQLIFSQKLVVGPSMYSTLRKGFSSETSPDNGDECAAHEERLKVVRSICITDKSLHSDLSTLMVVFPPESITAEECGVIRALQLGSSVSVCPEGKFLVQLSMTCSNESVGIEALQMAARSLLHCGNVAVEDKPTLLWAAFYVHDGIYPQGAKWVSAGDMAVCGMPDEMLHFRNVVASAENVFKGFYPEDAFFLQTPSSVVADADDIGVNEEVQNTDSNTADMAQT